MVSPQGAWGTGQTPRRAALTHPPLPELVVPFSLEPGDTGPTTCQREWSLAKSKGSSEARVTGFRSPLCH